MSENHYTVLGLPQNATNRQIRERFLAMARERHPDRFQGEAKARAEVEFQKVTQAFNVLTDPERRRQLDAELARPDAASPGHSVEAARIYLQRGVKAYRENSYNDAIENFDRATQEDPENAKAWYYLALTGQHLPRWKSQSRDAAARACKLEAMNPTYLKLAGSLFADAGEFAAAAKYYREALDWGEEEPEVRTAFEDALAAAKRKAR